MTSSKFIAVVCAAALGIASPALVSCGAHNDSGKSNSASAHHEQEPSTPEAVLDGYKSASAVMSGSLNLADMDKATVARIFSIYYAANEQFSTARDEAIEKNGNAADTGVFLGDFINKKDQRFLDDLYKYVGFDDRVIVDEAAPNAKYDLFYFTLSTSLSGDESVSEEAASAIDTLSPDAVTMDDENTAHVSLADFGDDGTAVLKRDNGMWKLFLDKTQVTEVTSLGLYMLEATSVGIDGDTPEKKGEFMADRVAEMREQAAQTQEQSGQETEQSE